MKRLIIFSLFVISCASTVVSQVIIIHPPIIRIGEASMPLKSSTIFSYQTTSKSSDAASLGVNYPVSAYVDKLALTVTFTEPVGIATILVYDANNQLVDMVTIDSSIDYEAVLNTDTWDSGQYTLVVTYGTTTLQGNFNF